MRTLSAALQSAHAAPVQMPAWLIEIGTSTPVRLSSHTTVTWNGNQWNAADVNVASLRVGALDVSGSLVFGNADDAYGALALTEGFTDKTVKIWGYDASISSPSSGDPVLVCDAIGAACEISLQYVRLALRDSTEFKVSPRAVVNANFGFTALLPAGTTITINGMSFVLERGR